MRCHTGRATCEKDDPLFVRHLVPALKDRQWLRQYLMATAVSAVKHPRTWCLRGLRDPVMWDQERPYPHTNQLSGYLQQYQAQV
jgi:hypothetical protein